MLTSSQFEEHLAHSIHSFLEEAPVQLREAIKYSLLAPGKRIRPRLVLETAALLGLPTSEALGAALSLEYFHCFSLIHDDLPCLDNDDFRRGRPSNHKEFGEATALLAGDALLALCYDAFFRYTPASVPKEWSLAAFQCLLHSTGPLGVIGGQVFEFELGPDSKIEDVLKLHELKTARLFEAAVLMPTFLKGHDPEWKPGRSLHQFAKSLGIAFQLVDDLEEEGAKEALDPKNILHFLDRKNAELLIRDPLQKATQDLEANFPKISLSGILEIAQGVLARL